MGVMANSCVAPSPCALVLCELRWYQLYDRAKLGRPYPISTKDSQDKRKRLVQLEAKGKAMQDQAADIPSQIRCRFPSINEQQALQLIELLDLVNSDLN